MAFAEFRQSAPRSPQKYALFAWKEGYSDFILGLKRMAIK